MGRSRGPGVRSSLANLRAKVLEQFDPKGDTMNINGRLCSFARRGLYTWILGGGFSGFLSGETYAKTYVFFFGGIFLFPWGV